jgi:putative flippase GtrA
MSPLAESRDNWAASRLPPRVKRLATDMVKYGFASAAALAWDVCLLLALNKLLGVDYLIASTAGFLGGLVLIYLLSVGFVFEGRRLLRPSGEFFGFIVTGLVGLALNVALMRLFVGVLCLPVVAAKVPTAGFVFAFNFFSRRAMFAAAPRAVAK